MMPEVGHHVEPVRAIQGVRPQPRPHELNQLVAEEDVDVRRQHKRCAGAPDPDVLGDHLKQRQAVRVRQGAMKLRRNHHQARLKPIACRPGQRFDERLAVGRRIPFDHQQLEGQLESIALVGEPVDEELGSRQLVSAVIVIARGRDHAQRGRVLRQAAVRGRAQIRVCQPSLCSNHLNNGIGIQWKYHTHSYSYLTYLSIWYGKM